MNDKLKVRGKGKLTATDPKTGKIIKVIKFKNLVVTVGKNYLCDMLIDTSAVYDVGLTYQEIGTDATAPAVGDVALTAYAARKAVTSRTRLGNVATFSTFFTAAQSAFAIEEAGIWGGSNAGAGEATGILFAHWLSSFDNSLGLYDITLDYLLTIS